MPIGSDHHSRRRSDLASDRELPYAIVAGVDQPDSTRPRRDVNAAGLTEAEEHGPGVVQQGEHARGTVGGVHVEVGHAPPEQRVPVSEVVVDVPESIAAMRLRALSMLTSSAMVSRRALVTVARAAECGLRHGVVQHPGTDRMPLDMVGVQEARLSPAPVTGRAGSGKPGRGAAPGLDLDMARLPRHDALGRRTLEYRLVA